MKYKKSIGIALALLFVYLFFFVANFPATRAFTMLRDARIPISALNVDGTVWSGKASGFSLSIGGRDIKLGKLNWSVNPFYLIVGKLRLSIEGLDTSVDSRYEADVTLGLSSLRLQNVKFNFPLSQIPNLYPPAAIARLSGSMNGQINDISFKEDLFSIQGNVTLDNVVSKMLSGTERAKYRIVLSDEKNTLVGNITTENGIPAVDGKISWRLMESGMAEFNGDVMPSAENSILRNLLLRFGRPGNDNSVQVRWQGRLFNVKQILKYAG